MKIFKSPVHSTLLFFFLVSLSSVKAQVSNGSISGKIVTIDNASVASVNVSVKEAAKFTTSSEDGSYSLKNIKPGTYTVVVSFVGLKSVEKPVTVKAGETANLDFILPENAAKLAEVIITGAKSINRSPAAVGKIAINPIDLPQSITVINSEVIENQQASKLSDVIKNVSGVSFTDNRGTSSESFVARGYSLGANNIMKNGSRSNSAVIPEASTLEKVEVLKGSAALLYGTVSSGAIINMVTKQPKFNFGGEIAMRTGSYNLFKPIGDIYGPISKKLAFRVVGTYEDAESFRNKVTSKRYYVNPSLLYNISSKTNLLIQGDYLNNDFSPDFGIGSLDGKIPTNISRSSYFNTPWAYNKVRQTTTTANLSHDFNPQWKLNVISSYQLFKRDYFSTERIQADAQGDWNRNLTRSKTNEDYYNGQINLTGRFETGKIGHTLLIGTDAERYMNISNGFSLTAAYDRINILDPSKYSARTDVPNAVLTSRTETPTYRMGYYIQDLVSLSEKVKILAGLRYSFQQINAAAIFDAATGEKLLNDNANTSRNRFERAISPRAGLVYQPVKNTSLFASYSNNFNPNTGLDVYGNNLKASIIDQYEVGIKNDFFEGKLSANFSLYKIVNHDLAIQSQYQKDGLTINTDKNVKEFAGETTSDGLEIDINGSITKGLNFFAGYSYNFMRFTKTLQQTGSYIEGERLVGTPDNTANATVFYTFPYGRLKGLKLGASGFYTGKRNAGWNNTVFQSQQYNRLIPLNGFKTFDFSAGYSFRKLSILAKVSNITDELSYLVHENYSVNPIPPRQFITTLAYKF